MAFDLSSLKLAATTELHLKNPITMEPLFDTEGAKKGEEGKPVLFHLYGSASKQHKQAIEASRRKAKNLKGREMTMEEQIESNAAFFAALTAGIDNLEYEGRKLDSADVITALYKDPGYSWIVEQVAEQIGSIDSFLTK